jgi:hypothetical protein
MKIKRWLYCPKCRCYPKKVLVLHGIVEETREWTEDGYFYTLVDTTLGDGDFVCGRCRTELITKEVK